MDTDAINALTQSLPPCEPTVVRIDAHYVDLNKARLGITSDRHHL
jgi:hypothetical protein